MAIEVYPDFNHVPKHYRPIDSPATLNVKMGGILCNRYQVYEHDFEWPLLRRITYIALCVLGLFTPLFSETFRNNFIDAWAGKTTVQVYTFDNSRNQHKLIPNNPLNNQPLQAIPQVDVSIIESTVSTEQWETSKIVFESLVKNSKQFLEMIKLNKSPTTNNNLEEIAKTQSEKCKVVQFAKETRPLLDSKVIQLITDFLNSKRKFGTSMEKKLYSQMNGEEFLERLCSKRPLMFMNPNDDYMLRNNEQHYNTKDTKRDFITFKDNEMLENYISYDEMQIGALLSISGPSFFVNDGAKDNRGKLQTTPFEKEAVIAGSVGCRFERPGVMEYQHMLITKTQNTKLNGYGANNSLGVSMDPWCKFYGVDHFPTFEEVQKILKTEEGKLRYVKIENDAYLDVEVYKKRLRLSIEPFLKDIDLRAHLAKKKAYVRLTGLGLGVWAIDRAKQTELMFEVVKNILQESNFNNVSNIDFMYVGKKGTKYQWPIMNGKMIDVECTQNTTSTKLPQEHEDKLLGSNYAWDGASFPGNEYWIGALNASMDPATASACQIKDLHNIYVNPYLKQNIKMLWNKI